VRALGAALAAALLLVGASAASQPTPEERARRAAATEEHYRETLQALGLGPLRLGAEGRDRNAPNAANYDEARVGAVPPLPPLLRTEAGRQVRTARQWWRVRRPELARLFETEMYGRVPASAPSIRWEPAGEERRTKAGKPVLTRRYVGRAADAPAGAPPLGIDLAVTLPADARGPLPLILELGFPEGFRFPGFAPPPGPDWTERVIERGWGYAILVPSTVQPDDGAGLREGVIGIASRGRLRAVDEWGALRAWAWGASRALDLLLKEPRIDRRRVAVEGLSRYGKAALVAMAFEPRFSLGFIGSSGAGGAKLLRRDFGERLENLAASGEYHWFAPNFLKYAGPRTVGDLPVDAHGLVALAAPRPLFIGAGNFNEDGWVDPRGSFEAARAASLVYRLLGVRGLVGDDYPAIGELRAGGRIAYRQHEGGHNNGPNWPAFLDFAAREWERQR
jgi:hypothetical protein